jgi:hypothetical protein
MKRRILIVLLAFGTVAGFTSAFKEHRERAERFERHVADVCVGAAQRPHGEVPAVPATKGPH